MYCSESQPTQIILLLHLYLNGYLQQKQFLIFEPYLTYQNIISYDSYSAYFNIIYLNMAEQEFEILVSTHDFLQLQSRYQELQLMNKKLVDERSQINAQMLELSVQNTSMQKKISKLNDHITYLSKQGFKMAQKLIKKDINQQNIDKSQKQYQLLTQSIKTQALISYKNLQQKMILKEMQHNSQKAELHNKIKDLTTTIQKMQQNQQNSSKLIKQIQNTRNLLQKQKQQLNYNNQQLVQRINRMKLELDILNSRYIEQNKKVSKLEGNLNQLKLSMNQSQSVNQYISQQVESKLHFLAEISEKDQQLIYLKDRVKGQDIQIKNLQTKVNQLKQKLKENKQTIKNYEKILINMEKEEKVQKEEKKPVKIMKKKEVTKQQIKDMIQEYFSMYKINLIESGGLTSKQINDILKSQKQPIIQFIEDSVNFMINLQKIEIEQEIHEKKKKKFFIF